MSYLAQVLREAQRVQLERGRVFIVEVLHDEWCPRLRGGTCICEAEVQAPKIVARPTTRRT